MRFAGIVLLFVGLVAVVVGTFSGCGSLFSWNGRHAVDVVPLGEKPTIHELVPQPGRRYTISIQVVFDREGLPKREGITVVDAKMSLVVRVKDAMGTSLAEGIGWLDPNDPPNVLYGQAARESRGEDSRPELVVERLVGPFSASSSAPLTVHVEIGADRVKAARILARRLVIYDDRLPPNIRNAFVVAAAGGISFSVGLGLTVTRWFKRRRKARKRGMAASEVM